MLQSVLEDSGRFFIDPSVRASVKVDREAVDLGFLWLLSFKLWVSSLHCLLTERFSGKRHRFTLSGVVRSHCGTWWGLRSAGEEAGCE